MRRLPMAIACAALATVSVHAVQSRTALCDGIAAGIRTIPNTPSNLGLSLGLSASQESLLTWLSKAPRRHIDVPESVMSFGGGNDVEKAAFLGRFRTTFEPSNELAREIAALVELAQDFEVFSAGGAGLHATVETGGTARCQSFVFFETAAGRQARRVPNPPKSEDAGPMAYCYNDRGYLARVGGSVVFLEAAHGETTYEHLFRVVPWRDGRWMPACSVEATFNSVFTVSNVFVPENGPIAETAVTSIASDVVAHRAAVDDLRAFRFGPRVPEQDRDRLRTMIGLVDETDIPGAETFPLVLGATTYLMRLGHETIGWRTYPDSLLVLYTLKDGKLERVASATVLNRRGTLKSLRVAASR